MNSRNQKLIDAIIARAEKVCPDSLALIGVYGSVATGDEHKRSDLDLLILIKDDEGWKLGTGFILNDIKVGYDIYCTNWEALRADAECHHAQLAKLMDSGIVYIKDQKAYAELCGLRAQTSELLRSDERFSRVDELIGKAKISYADSHLHETLGQVRIDAYYVMLFLTNALMLYHGTYFRRGVKRIFDELSSLPISENFTDNMRKIAASRDISELRTLLGELILYVESHVNRKRQKSEPSEAISGTYEEMYSNWRNKVEEAAENNDAFSAFMNMCSLNCMFSEISAEVDIGTFNSMEDYDPDHLKENVRVFDEYLRKYEDIYKKAGIAVRRYENIDEFVADYCESK